MKYLETLAIYIHLSNEWLGCSSVQKKGQNCCVGKG